jgi:hypothetical protein
VNWKHHLITAFLAFMAGGATVWFVGNLGQKADDPVLIAQIAELKDEVESERAASNTSYQEANDARESMLDTEIELAATQEELDAMRRRKNETPLQIVEERDALRVQNDKLVLNNGLFKVENTGLRVSRTHLVLALEASESGKSVMAKQYLALKKDKRVEKRKRIVQQIGTHAGVFVVAWIGGKYSQ